MGTSVEFIKSHKKATFIAGAILAAVVAIIIAFSISLWGKNKENQAPIIEETGFQTIIPTGKTIKELGGWERISPLNTAPVYAYADKIDGVTISVSQQPLPFTDDIDGQVSKLATAYSATNVLSANDTKVYIGTSAKGPQSAIFSKRNLLVLIKSQDNIEDKAWISYVDSLR